jgi:hypothetical protein
VRLKEAEHTAQQTVDTEQILRGLGLVSASVSDFLNGGRNTELDRLARAATRAQDFGLYRNARSPGTASASLRRKIG